MYIILLYPSPIFKTKSSEVLLIFFLNEREIEEIVLFKDLDELDEDFERLFMELYVNFIKKKKIKNKRLNFIFLLFINIFSLIIYY